MPRSPQRPLFIPDIATQSVLSRRVASGVGLPRRRGATIPITMCNLIACDRCWSGANCADERLLRAPGEAATIVADVLHAVAQRCSTTRPVNLSVVVLAFAVRFAPPARVVPRELLIEMGRVVATTIGYVLWESRSHLMAPSGSVRPGDTRDVSRGLPPPTMRRRSPRTGRTGRIRRWQARGQPSL